MKMRNKYIIGAMLFECVLIYFQLTINVASYQFKSGSEIITHKFAFGDEMGLENSILFIPLILLIESLLIKFPLTLGIKWMLFLQSILAIYCFLIGILVLHGLFYNNTIFPMGYYILIYNGIFVLWSVLLGFPPTRDTKVINWIFERRKEKIEIRS